jgi:hypothetical protein
MRSLDNLDRYELVALYGRLPVVIFGNTSSGDFELVDLDATPDKLPEVKAAIEARGLEFLGTVAILDGQPRSALADPLDTPTIEALAEAYNRHVDARLKDRIRETVPGDAITFLENLWSLADKRPIA